MKTKLIFLLPIVGIISCTSCNTSKSDPPIIHIEGSSKVTVAKDNWSFVLPSKDWEAQQQDAGLVADVLLINSQLHNIIIFLKEKFSGSLEEYSLLSIRGLAQAGGTFVKATELEINGNQFLKIESVKGSARGLIYLSVKNGFGYGFSCGGLDLEGSQERICSEVSSTLQIK